MAEAVTCCALYICVHFVATQQRLDWDLERVFLKVDSENTAAVKLYQKMGYKEVARVAEELMVPKSSTSVSEWPVLNIYMQRDMRPFSPFPAFNK